MSDWVKDNGVWKQTSGNSQQDLVGTRAEFDAIKDSLPDGSAFDTTDETVGGGKGIDFETIEGTTNANGNYNTGIDSNEYSCYFSSQNNDIIIIHFINSSGIYVIRALNLDNITTIKSNTQFKCDVLKIKR